MRTNRRDRLTSSERLALLEAQGDRCCLCEREVVDGEKLIDEHLRALGLGGTNDFGNRGIAHKTCADLKTYGPEGDLAKTAKAKRRKRKSFGLDDPPRRPFPGSRRDWRKCLIGGGVVVRATGALLSRPLHSPHHGARP